MVVPVPWGSRKREVDPQHVDLYVYYISMYIRIPWAPNQVLLVYLEPWGLWMERARSGSEAGKPRKLRVSSSTTQGLPFWLFKGGYRGSSK